MFIHRNLQRVSKGFVEFRCQSQTINKIKSLKGCIHKRLVNEHSKDTFLTDGVYEYW